MPTLLSPHAFITFFYHRAHFQPIQSLYDSVVELSIDAQRRAPIIWYQFKGDAVHDALRLVAVRQRPTVFYRILLIQLLGCHIEINACLVSTG